MKTLKTLFLIVLVSLTFASCGTKEVSKEVVSTASVVEDAKVDFSNPAFFAGSNFGEAFISMFKNQSDLAVKFTSKGSLDKFGVDKVRDKYESFAYNYNLVLASSKVVNDTITLKFTTNEYATGKFKIMKVVVENDSCKLVLPDNLDDLLK